MDNQKQLEAIRNYVYELFHNDATGHDYFHMKRVANMAKTIAQHERADMFICEAAGWLHDIGDEKLFSDSIKAIENMEAFLRSINITGEIKTKLKIATEAVSFSKGKTPKSLEGKIVQDADRIDAIGAIGIARTFAFGGAKGQMIYNDSGELTSIQHFYDKLLKLKDIMHTATAQKIAHERHVFMESYLDQFLLEWK